MFNVTELRLDKARSILDDYKEKLDRRGAFDALKLEHDLRKCWNTGYRSIKDAMRQLYRRNELGYSQLAEHYMRAGGLLMPMEFKSELGLLHETSSG